MRCYYYNSLYFHSRTDHSIRILVLKCFKEVIILEPKTNEQMQIIQNCDYGPNTTDASETRRDPWIISYCYNQLRVCVCMC